MRRITAISCVLVLFAGAAPALAGECAGNPNALGTSRTLAIDAGAHPRLGAHQYAETLPLADREVVLTFDDGPLAPYSNRILDILASECVKATYFLVGRMAQSAPELVRRIQKDGHTIGTHSLNHPLTFDRMPLPNAEREIDGGIAAVSRVLGAPSALSPFFRIPGLLRSSPVENYLASRSLVTWSVDLVADDWHRGISAAEVTQRALYRLEARGRGILLLHDIQPATALALPGILKGLKARGFRVVHVVPAGADQPKTYTEPQQWASHGGKRGWSRVASAEFATINASRPVPSQQSFGLGHPFGPKAMMSFAPAPNPQLVVAAAGEQPLPVDERWPSEISAVAPAEMALPPGDPEIVDWPLTARVAEMSPLEPAAWPAVPKLHQENAKIAAAASSPRQRRVSTSTLTCRNGDLIAARLTPRCQKPSGHRLSLQPYDPAG
jgi:peptidoglycan/xylan/chitin deacetylase (PgdA/CDA1 family)